MRRSFPFRRWLWEGTLTLDATRLEVCTGLPGEDLHGFLLEQLEEIQRQTDTLEEALRRERAKTRRGGAPAPPPGRDDDALRAHAKSMLPAMDALDRLLAFAQTVENPDEVFLNWIKGVEALRTRLTKVLEGIGLQAISSVGMEVDLNVHDVVGVVPAGEFPPNTVVEEQQKGYYFQGKLLRDARVIVAQ